MKPTLHAALIVALVIILVTGLFLSKDGIRDSYYSGDLQDDLPQGFGTWKHPGGAYYAGNFEQGQWNGRGTWYHPDGIKYAGYWQDGRYHGLGTLVFADGNRYNGYWYEGKKVGAGIHTLPDGTSYRGYWENDRYEGFGILRKPGHYTYRGWWVAGQRHGEGSAFFSDGSEYHGHWLYDMRHGEGTMVFTDGTVYEGQWAHNNPHGEGTLVTTCGTVKTATWIEGEMLEVAVESLDLEPDSLALVEDGEKMVILALIEPEDATGQQVRWESSNPEVAAIDEYGVLTPLAAGNAIVTATTACENHQASIPVTVSATKVPATGIVIDRNRITMRVGEKTTLLSTIRPPNATNRTVSWSSSNPAVANAFSATTRRGNLLAFSPGETLITVTTADGGFSAVCRVTVLPKEDPARRVIVPRLVGQMKETARTMIENAGLYTGNVSYEYHLSAPENQVISQNPAIGATANLGSAVHIVLSKGLPPEDEPVPDPDQEQDIGEEPEPGDLDDENDNLDADNSAPEYESPEGGETAADS